MMLTLYYFEASPPARAVLMVIAALELEVQLVRVNLTEKEQFSEAYLKLNPTHTVPTLEDNGFVVWDSHCIVQYLVDNYGQAQHENLYPKEFRKRTKVNQMLFFETSVLFPSLAQAVRPVFYDDAKSIPQGKLNALECSFQFLEAFLASNGYLAGNNLTVADICALATVSTICIFHSINEEKYPKLVGWLNRLKKFDFYKANLEGIVKFGDMMLPLLK